ncbi:MAG: hypothetical protein ACRDRG_00025 [Pseudonocardiaceae bacterium]
MDDAGVELELVVSADREVTVPASELARLPVMPGQRVRVRVEATSAVPRTLLGALVKPGRARLTIDDFDAISNEVWGGSGYGR